MVEDNKSRRLCGFGGRTPFKKFNFLSTPYGIDGLSPEENTHAQYSAQRDSSKELLDSSLDIHTYEDKVGWLKKARFRDGIQDISLGRLVKWDEIPSPSEESIDVSFRKELENQVELFIEAKKYFSKDYPHKMCG